MARRVGFGSVPNGELLALNDAGDTVGSLLAGSADEWARDVSLEMFRGEAPGARTFSVEVHGPRAAAAGLSCGGQATLVVELAKYVPQDLWNALVEHRSATLTTVVRGSDPAVVCSRVCVDGHPGVGTTGDPVLDDETDSVGRQLLDSGEPGVRLLDASGEAVLVEAFVPQPRLVVLGAGDLAEAITAQAQLLGWEARTCPDVASASTALDWGGRSAALVVLSHDPAIDAAVIRDALAAKVTYIGALGSRRTQLSRAERLRNLGVSDADIERVRGPIGLDLGGRQPSHVALAV
ncbi:MAG TPA: XdhC family protein, partial [Acidimicrobiales bacterium]|nr:XdhC family protein [Acidimicrobiales bacterium]